MKKLNSLNKNTCSYRLKRNLFYNEICSLIKFMFIVTVCTTNRGRPVPTQYLVSCHTRYFHSYLFNINITPYAINAGKINNLIF